MDKEVIEAAKRESITHELKTDAEVFQAICDGRKTYEIRYADRDFQVGDELYLRETVYTGEQMRHRGGQCPLLYSGREYRVRISHILRGPIYGLADGWAILSLATPPADVAEPIIQSNERMRSCYRCGAICSYINPCWKCFAPAPKEWVATPPASTTPDAALLEKAEQLYAPELDPSTGDFGGRVWQFAHTCKDLATALRERGQQLDEMARERDAAITKLAENVEQYTTIVSSAFAILTGSWTPDVGCSAVESAALTMRTRAEQAEAQLALHQRDACEHCGSKRIVNSRPGCLHCGAPNCCQTCCEIATLESDLAQARAQLAKEECATSQLIDERDQREALLDEFVSAVGEPSVHGEHSNVNCPWRNALNHVEELQAQLALCAENTTAADLAQEVECLKAEKEALREALGKIAARDTGYDRKKVDNLINSDNGDEVAEGAEMGEAHTCANIARAALAIGGEVVG